ncbi:MAG: zinc ABC transporter substrate-binding protein [Selenomonadaceae bacterium]|nr:zinc ABC transporter substrate-binding protein [Selenomonadaceae bacterium]
MKKFLLLVVMLLTMNFSACGVDKPAQNDSDKIKIVTTIFPAYDWTREIIGDETNFDLTLLGGTGVDLHSFQPSAQDIMKISTCDVLICVGGESDDRISDALKQSTNKNLVVVKLLDVLGDKILTENHDGHVENDEHVWLSLKNAQILCEKISDVLIKADPSHEKIFRTNVAAYNEKLAALDEKYRETISAAPVKTILFGDRFPFRYLCDDYGLKYFAAFAGCSAETEASFETIKFLADKVDELKLPCVLTIEGTNHKIAETIIANTAGKSQKILVLDSMQSVADGNYLSTMTKNLEVLREALSK